MNHKILLLATLALAAPAWPQIQIPSFDLLASKSLETVDITLDSNMLKMAAGFLGSSKTDDPKLKNALAGVKAISVKSFKFAQQGQYNAGELDPIRKQLQAPAWSRIVSSKTATELSEIFIKMEQGNMAGLVILAAEPRELTVVSIEGLIDLNSLASLGGQFGIPPDLLSEKNEKNKDKDKAKGTK